MASFWRTVATVLLSVVVTLLGGWLTIGNKLVSAADVEKQVDQAMKTSPYAIERQSIHEKLGELPEIKRKLGELERGQERIETKLNILLRRDDDGD